MIFSASIMMKSIHPDNEEKNSLWEEKIVAIEALDESDACRLANEIGKKEEQEYINNFGNLVKWIFVKIERVCRIEPQEIRTGTELFSRFLRHSEAKSILLPFDDTADES